MVAVILTVVSRSVAKTFQITPSQPALKRAVHKYIAASHFANNVGTRTIKNPAFTVPVAKFLKNEVGKRSIEEANVYQHWNKPNKAFLDHKKA